MFDEQVIAQLRSAYRPQGSQAPGTPVTAPPKKKNFWLDQISTAGGIIGGIGGTLVAPVVGTAAGGAAGSALGETLENFLTGNKLTDNVLKEGALGGVFAGGPLRLGKAALGAKNALKSGAADSVGSALKMGGEEASKFTLRGAIGSGLQNKATGLASKQFGLTGRFVGNYTKKYGEDAGKTITRYGIQSPDDAAEAIAKQNTIFDQLVQNAGPIKKTTLQQNLDTAADDLLKQMPRDQQKVGQNLIDEARQLMDNFGDSISATELNAIRKQYDGLVNYTMQQADPFKYGVNKRVADALRETVQGAAGKQLKETGREISKLITLSDEIAARAPTVAGRGVSPFGLRNLMGATAGAGAGAGMGGAVGGPVGAVVGMGLTAAANSPAGRRVATNTALSLGNKFAGKGAQVAGKGMSPTNIAGRVAGGNMLVGAFPDSDQETVNAEASPQGLEDVFSQPMGGAQMPQGFGGQVSQDPYGGMEGADMPGMSGAETSPYSKQNLLADMQRDPENANKYIAYYQQLDEIFNPKGANGLELPNTAIARISDYESGINALDGLGQSIAGSNVNSPILGNLRRKNPFDTGAQDLNSSIRSVRQLVGKALEGGVLRREDEVKYEQMLPKIGDTDATARAKIENVRALLTGNLNAFKQNSQFYSGAPQTLEDVYANQQQGAY